MTSEPQADSDHSAEPQAVQPRGATTRAALRLVHALTDLVLPPLCLSCSARLNDHDALCARCWRDMHFLTPPVCDRLGIPLPYDAGEGAVSALALAEPPPYGRARAVAAFDGPMRDLVHQFKYADRHDARRLFGRWMRDAGRALIDNAEVLVPVPLSRWRLFTRRFNQAQILSTEISRLTGKPTRASILKRRHASRRQTELSRSERQRNVAGRFLIDGRDAHHIAGRRVLLIDDVITTGATVSAATRTLKIAGAANVDVLSLAMTLRR